MTNPNSNEHTKTTASTTNKMKLENTSKGKEKEEISPLPAGGLISAKGGGVRV